ncbi:MAG: AAA family ATPase, partial [Polyangiaceae bacterium]
VAHCQEWESVPFKGFDAIVDQLAGHLRALAPEQFAGLEQPAAAAAHLFPVLRGFAPPSLAQDDSTPVERRSRAFRGLRAILRKLSEQRPVCIAIDNLQWADADGARLLLELVSGSDAPRMLVVGVHRAGDEQSSPFLHSFFEQQRERGFAFDFEAFEVPPLDENDGRRLAARLLGARFTQETATRVALESGGNPLFLELFAQHLCEEAEAGSHDLDALTLRDVIDARMRRLAPSEQQIMDVVAVAGQPTEQRIVMAIAGSGNDAQHALTMLRRGGWTRTGGPRIHDMIEVSHQRLREGIVARMGRDRLSEIHAELAATLAPLPTTDPERLARHYFGAGDASSAGKHAEIAADRAAAVLAFDRAAALYQDALSTVSDRGERWRSLSRRLAESLAAAGHCSAAARHFAAAVSGAGPAEALELRRLAGENHLVAGDIDAGLEALRPLLAEVDEPYPESTPLMVTSMIRDLLRSELPARLARNTSESDEEVAFRADLTWSLGKVLSAVLPLQGTYFMLRSLHDARVIDDVVRTGRVLAVLGAALSMQSGIGARLGRYYLGRARGMAKRADSEYLDGFCTIGEALGALVAGQWTVSRRGIDRGLELLQRGQRGVVWERNFGEAGAIRALEAAGDLTELGRRAEAWYRDSSERGDRWSAGGGLYFSGIARLGQGEVGDVRRYARQARESLSSTTYTVQHFYTMRLDVLCDLYERRPEAAWTRLEQEWRLIEKAHLLRVSLSRIDVLVLRAAILASHAPNHFGHDQSWRECENIAKRLSEEERPDGAAHALAIRGVLAARLGQPRAAITRLKEAARRFEDLDMQLLSAVNERAAAALADDSGRRKKADARLHKLGVKEPSLFAEVFVPAAVLGRPSSRPPDVKATLQK